jgi:cytochrome b6-f complex iron-sulfur subunit
VTTQGAGYGVVHGPPRGEISRRGFMRRMLGVGVGILSLEFLGGTVAFLWPNLREGLGARINIGTAADINANAPEWQNGLPYIYQAANLFVVNVPAAMARVEGTGQAVQDPGEEIQALWRTCPHLGCQIPQLCDQSNWFECLCHGSKYTVLGEKRDGPAPRGMDRFATAVENGSYIIDTREVISGSPPGTATFDTRGPGDMPHCSA